MRSTGDHATPLATEDGLLFFAKTAGRGYGARLLDLAEVARRRGMDIRANALVERAFSVFDEVEELPDIAVPK